MDHNQIEVSLLKNNAGMVLVMVLLVMVATIIVGVTLMNSSTVETKIVGNERAFTQDFYTAESASEYIIPMFDAVASATAWNVDNERDITAQMQPPVPGIIANSTVMMTLRRTGTPPVGSGTSAANSLAYYFRIKASSNDQNVETGVWKAFPMP